MKNELATSIGKAARQARKALQLTQEDTAERINVSVEFYARIERGTSLPSILTFARIVAVLHVSADALLGRQPVNQISPPEVPWQPLALPDTPEMRRLMRRLRKAKPSTLRLVSLFLREMERTPASNDQTLSDEDATEDCAEDELLRAASMDDE